MAQKNWVVDVLVPSWYFLLSGGHWKNVKSESCYNHLPAVLKTI